jgi:hypothetical protein
MTIVMRVRVTIGTVGEALSMRDVRGVTAAEAPAGKTGGEDW